MASYSHRTSRPPVNGAKGEPRARRRSPGEGSVYPVRGKDGRVERWRGLVTWTEPDGTQGRRYVSGRTQAETREKVDRVRAELRIGGMPSVGASVTVADYLAGWLERNRMRVRPATWANRESQVRVYLVPSLGRIPLARLAPSEVESAMASWLRHGRPVTAEDRRRGVTSHDPVGPVTVRHVRTTLRTALADAVREGIVARNAAADARPPHTDQRPVEYLTAPDVRKLIAATSTLEYGQLYALAAMTGLRLGELLGLAWRDVTADTLSVRNAMTMQRDGTYALGMPKTARSRRTIPLPATARKALELRRQRQDADRAAAGSAWQDRQGLVFTDRVGQPLTPARVSSRFRDDIARVDVPRVRFHDLRHSAATMMLAEGVPLPVISEWLGHSGIAITAQHYAAVVPELRRDAAAAMDRAMDDEP